MSSTHCTHHQQQPEEAHCHHKASAHSPGWSTAANATVHCLTGCAIGEFIGLAIGVQLGLAPMHTMALAVTLAFISGYALTLIPFMRQGISLKEALKLIWLAEFISISVMEIAMNFTDYQMGGMSVASLAEPRFWWSYGAALIAGFLAAWPVNLWLLRRGMKNCHPVAD